MEFDAPQTRISAPQMEFDAPEIRKGAPETRMTAPEMDFDFIPSSKTALYEDGLQKIYTLSSKRGLYVYKTEHTHPEKRYKKG